MAYDTVEVPAGLPLLPARRESKRPPAPLCELADHDGAGRAVAWRRLDLSFLGRPAWILSGHQSCMAPPATALETRYLRAALASVQSDADFCGGRDRMGIFPRDQSSDSLDDAGCDGRFRHDRRTGPRSFGSAADCNSDADRILRAQFARDHAARKDGLGHAKRRRGTSRRRLEAVDGLGSDYRLADGNGGARRASRHGR